MSGLSRRSVLAAGGGAGALLVPSASTARGVPPGRTVHLMQTYVAGSDRYGAPEELPNLAQGDRLELVREADHDYDPRAVAVWSGQGRKLGYVPRAENAALASLLDAGFVAVAHVASARAAGRYPDIRLDVTLHVI